METRLNYFVFAIFFFVTGIITSYIYRPYIYKNNIYDFHLADTIGNWVAVPSATCFFLAISNKKMKLELRVGYIILIFIAYEFMGLLGLHGVFDLYDIMATIVTGAITYCVLKKISKFPQL